MASTIDTTNIDTTYPIAGQDNDSQGFRDNFTNTNTNFIAAKAEIEDLQNKVILKSALTGGSVDNDFGGNLLLNAVIENFRGTVVNTGIVAADFTIDVSAGPYHKVITQGSITAMRFASWPQAGEHGLVQVEIFVSDLAHTVTLADTPPVWFGLDGVQTAAGNTITFLTTGKHILEFASTDNGATVSVNQLTVDLAAVSTGMNDLIDDTTPTLGGPLDVGGEIITSSAAGNIAITPDGTGILVLDGINWPISDGTNGQVLKTNGSAQLSWAAAGIASVVADTAPTLGGDLDVAGNSIITAAASNGDIAITPDGAGSIILDGLSWPQVDGTTDYVLKTDGAGQLSWALDASGALTLNWTDGTQAGNGLSVAGVGTPAMATLTPTSVVISGSVSDELRTYTWDGVDWVQQGNSLTITGAGIADITALDSANLAYFDVTRLTLETYSWDGTDWTLPNAGLSIPGAGVAGLATLDSSTIAFYDNTTLGLSTYSWSGTTWSIVNNTLTVATAGLGKITALDSTTIAFHDVNNDELRTYSWDGTDWSLVGNGLTITTSGAYMTTLNSTDIAFADTTANTLTIYRWDGSDWTQNGNSLTIAGMGTPGITAINDTDIAYVDGSNNSLRTYRFDFTIGDAATSATLDLKYVNVTGDAMTGDLSVIGDIAVTGNMVSHDAFNAQTGLTYPVVLTDDSLMITMNNASANTATIPANSLIAFPIGTKLNFMQLGAGATTIAITTDTLDVNGNFTLVLNGQYAVATALKVGATSWVLFGNLVAV